jgi:hypothetical protein
MKKKLLSLLIGLGILALPFVVDAAIFNSNQVGASPSGGYVLQTNGATSSWVATSSLGISGGGGSSTVLYQGNGILLNTSGTNGYIINIATGTAGYFPFWNAAGNALTPTSSIFVSSTGNVGIGTPTPNSPLQVVSGTTNYLTFDPTLFNTFIGQGAGNFTATGTKNVGVGYLALHVLTTGNNNTANGYYSLVANTTGNNNTANGYASLYGNTTGGNNTANGYQAGRFISGGVGLNQTSTYSTYIGFNAYPLASGDTNETVIGNGAVGSGSNTVTLGGTGTTGTIIPYGNVGIGTPSPSSTLTVNGSFATNLQEISTSTTIAATSSIVGVTSITTPITITLPPVSSMAEGSEITVKDEAGDANTYNITVQGSATSQKIDGATTTILTSNYQAIKIYENGSNWYIE